MDPLVHPFPDLSPMGLGVYLCSLRNIPCASLLLPVSLLSACPLNMADPQPPPPGPGPGGPGGTQAATRKESLTLEAARCRANAERKPPAGLHPRPLARLYPLMSSPRVLCVGCPVSSQASPPTPTGRHPELLPGLRPMHPTSLWMSPPRCPQLLHSKPPHPPRKLILHTSVPKVEQRKSSPTHISITWAG